LGETGELGGERRDGKEEEDVGDFIAIEDVLRDVEDFGDLGCLIGRDEEGESDAAEVVGDVETEGVREPGI